MRQFINVKITGIEEVLCPLGMLEIQECKGCGRTVLSAYEDPIWCMACETKRDKKG
uniref:Uncharacterized protein n=1 Tax=viral metagenome TaxID=1070528 RepID=A0A6M3XY67_9ZZZZ